MFIFGRLVDQPAEPLGVEHEPVHDVLAGLVDGEQQTALLTGHPDRFAADPQDPAPARRAQPGRHLKRGRHLPAGSSTHWLSIRGDTDTSVCCESITASVRYEVSPWT